MTSATLHQVTHQHCHAHRPPLTLKAFVQEHYGVSYSYFSDVRSGRRNPSGRLLASLSATHARLHPEAPVRLLLPKQPPVIIGSSAPHHTP